MKKGCQCLIGYQVLDPMALSYEFERVEIDDKSMAETSNSMLRKPTQLQDYARGKIGNVPFTPGGDSLVQTTTTSDHVPVSCPAKHQVTEDLAPLALASSSWEDHVRLFDMSFLSHDFFSSWMHS